MDSSTPRTMRGTSRLPTRYRSPTTATSQRSSSVALPLHCRPCHQDHGRRRDPLNPHRKDRGHRFRSPRAPLDLPIQRSGDRATTTGPGTGWAGTPPPACARSGTPPGPRSLPYRLHVADIPGLPRRPRAARATAPSVKALVGSPSRAHSSSRTAARSSPPRLTQKAPAGPTPPRKPSQSSSKSS